MKKVLVVDDDVDILDAIGMLLEDANYEVEKILKWSPKQFFGRLPNLILLDIFLSGQDGREIAKKIKAKSSTQKIPIIMMSAYPAMDCEVAKIGVAGFLAKPFDADDLLDTVATHIN